ncbi:hypothetical protein HanXRQr2_Chr16g0728181 [Helianthus annuus]|uniref:Uncharacterized protein n=1 Tax=Helianthus annuus TaxID=4232 RepID=A0A9K3DQG2_HELAN|nr:hypothetical protein HanXRQr2_Chr16g0728181 [Helianthus annuus]KAJ0819621.1 hypothetical protein HanPSC8_Chr16g0698171 [Helianthus annuus]
MHHRRVLNRKTYSKLPFRRRFDHPLPPTQNPHSHMVCDFIFKMKSIPTKVETCFFIAISIIIGFKSGTGISDNKP